MYNNNLMSTIIMMILKIPIPTVSFRQRWFFLCLGRKIERRRGPLGKEGAHPQAYHWTKVRVCVCVFIWYVSPRPTPRTKVCIAVSIECVSQSILTFFPFLLSCT